MGEEICAFIKLEEGQESAVQEIRDYCRGKVRPEPSHHLCLSHVLTGCRSPAFRSLATKFLATSSLSTGSPSRLLGR